MRVSECRPYDARIVDCRLVRGRSGVRAFKIYRLSIVGRKCPARYEWEACGLPVRHVEQRLAETIPEGVGFVTAFPHITKVFRFAPEMETVLHVTAFDTGPWSPVDLSRPAGFVEFACLAEAEIAAHEYTAWADAESVEDYLKFRSPFAKGQVKAPSKLAAWAHEG